MRVLWHIHETVTVIFVATFIMLAELDQQKLLPESPKPMKLAIVYAHIIMTYINSGDEIGSVNLRAKKIRLL